jgi:hypothetical protein
MRIDSKAKGSSFERLVCSRLSLWISTGQRSNIFSRNVLSGGAFTVASGKGHEVNLPGDIAASHPLAFEFLSLFCVEAKHRKGLFLDAYLWDPAGKNFMARVYEHAANQAASVGLQPMVIARQNYSPTIVLMPCKIGMLACASSYPANMLSYHCLHRETVAFLLFNQLLRYVRPLKFLNAVKELNK